MMRSAGLLIKGLCILLPISMGFALKKRVAPSAFTCAKALLAGNDEKDFYFIFFGSNFTEKEVRAKEEIAIMRQHLSAAANKVFDSLFLRGPELATTSYTISLVTSLLANGDRFLVEQALTAASRAKGDQRLNLIANLWGIAHERRVKEKNEGQSNRFQSYHDLFEPYNLGRRGRISTSPQNMLYLNELKAVIPRINGVVLAEQEKDGTGYFVWRDKTARRTYYYVADHNFLIFCTKDAMNAEAEKRHLPKYEP